jgi:serine/threonine protein phosphatase 1
MKTIVIGDIHGCIKQVWELMNLIGPSAGDRIIPDGDFTGRGPDTPACVQFVREHEGCMGNHEYKHVRYRHKIGALSRSQIEAKKQFESPAAYEAAVDLMESLPFYFDLPEALVVHAGVEYGTPMEEQDRIVLVGGMSKRHICGIDPSTGLPFWCAKYPRDAKPVIFGHLSIEGSIPRNENLFPLDTGCCRGEKLTAISIPDFQIYQVPGWKRE